MKGQSIMMPPNNNSQNDERYNRALEKSQIAVRTDVFEATAEVHMSLPKGYRLKAGIPSIGFYINGMKVLKADPRKEEWEVYPPSHLSKEGWLPTIEFDKHFPLWQEIKQACLDAVDREELKDMGVADSGPGSVDDGGSDFLHPTVELEDTSFE